MAVLAATINIAPRADAGFRKERLPFNAVMSRLSIGRFIGLEKPPCIVCTLARLPDSKAFEASWVSCNALNFENKRHSPPQGVEGVHAPKHCRMPPCYGCRRSSLAAAVSASSSWCTLIAKSCEPATRRSMTRAWMPGAICPFVIRNAKGCCEHSLIPTIIANEYRRYSRPLFTASALIQCRRLSLLISKRCSEH